MQGWCVQTCWSFWMKNTLDTMDSDLFVLDYIKTDSCWIEHCWWDFSNSFLWWLVINVRYLVFYKNGIVFCHLCYKLLCLLGECISYCRTHISCTLVVCCVGWCCGLIVYHCVAVEASDITLCHVYSFAFYSWFPVVLLLSALLFNPLSHWGLSRLLAKVSL